MAPLDEGGWKVGIGGLCSMLDNQLYRMMEKRGTGAHKVSKGTFIHRTADVRRTLSLERWGMTPREVVVKKDGVGRVKCVSAEGRIMDPSRGPKDVVRVSERLKEKEGVDIREMS